MHAPGNLHSAFLDPSMDALLLFAFKGVPLITFEASLTEAATNRGLYFD